VWRTTVSVTLPNTQRFTPERPWEHIAMKLSGVFRPREMTSSAPKPSFVLQVTLATPSFSARALLQDIPRFVADLGDQLVRC
jgi:hypothetical protein